MVQGNDAHAFPRLLASRSHKDRLHMTTAGRRDDDSLNDAALLQRPRPPGAVPDSTLGRRLRAPGSVP